MKKFKLILVILLGLLILPFSVLAEDGDDEYYEEEVTTEEVSEESSEEVDNRVKIYFFRGEGCPHCAEAEEFFESIQEEYGAYFTIVDYETWYDEENAALLEKVAEARDEEVTGVPYIIIGNKSWKGYSSDFDEELIEAINSEYETAVAERYDVMEYVKSGKKAEEKSYASDVVALLIIIIVIGGIVTGIVFARKKAK